MSQRCSPCPDGLGWRAGGGSLDNPPSPPSIPACAKASWLGPQGLFFHPLSLSRLEGSSRRPAQLAAFIDSFCSNKADGAELKTKITQNNLKPRGRVGMGGGGGWRGGYPCRRDASARRDSWSPKGGTGQPPCSAWVRSWGGGAGGRLGTRGQAKPGWAPEGRAVPLGQAGWTLGLCWDLHPRGVLALTPPPLLPSSRHSQCPSTAQFVPPPAPPPPPHPQLAWVPV